MGIGLSRLQKLATSAAKKAKAAGRASKKKPDLTSKEYKAQQVAKRNAARKAERAEALKVKKGKAIAKKKAIQKNVAAKKARDAAGMAKAKALATKGMTAAAKKKPTPKAAAAGGGKKPPTNGKKTEAAKRKANAAKYKNSPAGKAAAARAKARAAATPTAKKTKFGYSASPRFSEGNPRTGKVPIHSTTNINAYKEAIMIKEGLNTWPSTRDPFPRTPPEFKVWDKVGSYRK
jgi:hypothetical protein